MNIREVYRINIAYKKPYGKSGGCMFIIAASKEDAAVAATKELTPMLIDEGFPKDCFKLEVNKSSMDEAEFYKRNKYNKSYSGLMN